MGDDNKEQPAMAHGRGDRLWVMVGRVAGVLIGLFGVSVMFLTGLYLTGSPLFFRFSAFIGGSSFFEGATFDGLDDVIFVAFIGACIGAVGFMTFPSRKIAKGVAVISGIGLLAGSSFYIGSREPRNAATVAVDQPRQVAPRRPPDACGWRTKSETDPITDERATFAVIRSDPCDEQSITVTVRCKATTPDIQILWPRPLINAWNDPERSGRAFVTVRFGSSDPHDLVMSLSRSQQVTMAFDRRQLFSVNFDVGIVNAMQGKEYQADWKDRDFTKLLAGYSALAVRGRTIDSTPITGTFDLSKGRGAYAAAIDSCVNL